MLWYRIRTSSEQVFLMICWPSFESYFFLQASEDAKKLVDEERSFAKAEIENAKAAVQRVEEALQEHERLSKAAGKQVLLKFFWSRLHNGFQFSVIFSLLGCSLSILQAKEIYRVYFCKIHGFTCRSLLVLLIALSCFLACRPVKECWKFNV